MSEWRELRREGGTMINVACAADEAYAPHCAAMLHSLIAHHDPARVFVHFLHSPAMAPTVLERLGAYVAGLGAQICFHAIPDDRVAGLPEMGRISRVMWYRAFLPELLPDQHRVLYLDCDVIVMRDLAELWNTDFDGALLAAVRNVFERGREQRARNIGLGGPAEYFNSGVLLLNLAAWRAEDRSRSLLEYARCNAQRLAWPDQDALNVSMRGRWLPLHPRWNCQNSLYYLAQARAVFGAQVVEEATRAPAILHFEGGGLAKPWHYLCKHPLRADYLRHRAHTPWPLVAPEGRTLANRLLRPLPMNLLLPALRFVHRAQNALHRRLPALVPAP